MHFSYEEAVAYINDVPRFTSKNEPGNTRELMRRLGDPQEAFPVIHVAGTNGKGSVCAFLESALRKAGRRTGLFTSPHLIRINERFQVNRVNIMDEQFLAGFELVMEAVRAMEMDGFKHPTYFELLFALGMTVFREQGIEILVMETGLGGRLDATNVVRAPLCCVITSISLDHTAYLGDTVAQIAAEKAGIIKEGVPVIYDDTDPEASAVIRRRAEDMHAPCIPVNRQMCRDISQAAEGLQYTLSSELFDALPVYVPFRAAYQVMNSAAALTALRVIDPGKTMPDKLLSAAVRETVWSGRMQRAAEGIIFDGAHNEAGIRCLADTIRETSRTQVPALLFSAVSDKDYPEMIRELTEGGAFAYIVVTRVPGSRGVPADELARLFRCYTDAPVLAAEDPAEAFSMARRMRREGQILFCAGSLYLIGELEKEIAKDDQL